MGRDAELRGPATRDRRAEHSRRRQEDTKVLGNLFEVEDRGPQELKGIHGAGARLGGAAAEHG